MKKISIVFLLVTVCVSLAIYPQTAYCQKDGRFAGEAKGKEFKMREGRQERDFELKAWIEKEMPELSAELKKMKTEDPKLCRLFMQELNSDNQFKHMIRRKNLSDSIKNIAKELLSNEFLSFKLAKQYKLEKKEELQGQLKELLNKSFELKEQLQLAMLQKMEERINSVKEMIVKRKGLKDEIVSDRLTELTSDQEVTKW